MKISRYLSHGVVALSLAAASGAALAQNHTVLTKHYYNGGAYVNIHAGASKPTTKTFTNIEEPEYFYTLDSDWGYDLGAAMGYRYRNYRTEFAINHQSSSIDEFSGEFPVAPINFDGVMNHRLEATTFMWNSYYDFTNYTCFVPYIGFGLGVAHVQHDSTFDERGIFAKGSDTVFAYQGILGVSAEVATNWRASLDYRYLNTSKGRFFAIDNDGQELFYTKGRYTSHQINLGLTYFIS
jgi:opacity protein-like surface antigen